MNTNIKNKKINLHKQQLMPWTTDQNHLASIILQSTSFHRTIPQNHPTNHVIEDQEKYITISKDYQSYNFYNNLRKYEKKKGLQFQINKERNFIEKNKKWLNNYSNYASQNSDNSLMVKYIQDYKRKRSLQNNNIPCAQTVNMSQFMYMDNEENRSIRHRDIQGFLNFQKSKKQMTIKKSSTRNIQNQEDNKYQLDKYQKLLKVRENLRLKNLKSSEKSRKKLYHSLNIIQAQNQLNCQKNERSLQKQYQIISKKSERNNPFYYHTERTFVKTSQSSRKRKTIQEDFNSLCDSTISIKQVKAIKPVKPKDKTPFHHRNRHLLNTKGNKLNSN